MDFPLYFQILRGRVQGVFFQAGKQIFVPNGLYLPTKSRWGPRSLDFDITTYSYPLLGTFDYH